jgi:PTH1 family peptidyl-tRNA hydrolase
MRLVVGLGNPGQEHVGNRHNIGFMAVEEIARRHAFPPWRRRFQGVATEGAIGPERVLLLLPGTYMNESGRAVGEADLPLGKLRVKTGGGAAGHNGLRSITAHIGNDYRRVRVGVGHPGDKDLMLRHVLGDFAKAERPLVEALCGVIADNAALLAKGDDATFQNKVHLAMQAKGFGAADASDD